MKTTSSMFLFPTANYSTPSSITSTRKPPTVLAGLVVDQQASKSNDIWFVSPRRLAYIIGTIVIIVLASTIILLIVCRRRSFGEQTQKPRAASFFGASSSTDLKLQTDKLSTTPLPTIQQPSPQQNFLQGTTSTMLSNGASVDINQQHMGSLGRRPTNSPQTLPPPPITYIPPSVLAQGVPVLPSRHLHPNLMQQRSTSPLPTSLITQQLIVEEDGTVNVASRKQKAAMKNGKDTKEWYV